MNTREYDFRNARRGPVKRASANKTRITIRVDTDTLDWFRNQVHETGGGDYQSLINEALREHIESKTAGLELTLRRVIREEIEAKANEKRIKRRRIARKGPAYIGTSNT